MDPFNLKILPFVISALVFSYLTFATAISLATQIEIMLSLEKVLIFILILSIHIGITALSIAIILSQLKSLPYRAILFLLLFLPYATVFILGPGIAPMVMIVVFVLFIAMTLAILTEFNRSYSNQIKTRIETPAKSNAKSIAFFVALTTALIFFSVNNNPKNEKILSDKIMDITTITITKTVEDYKLLESMGGQDLPKAAKAQLNKQIVEQITTMIRPYLPYIIYILALLIFATIAGTSTFAGIFTTLLGIIIIYLLKSVGYVKEEKQTVEVTRITL